MFQRILRSIVLMAAAAFVSFAPALAQSDQEIALSGAATGSWETAQAVLAGKGKLIVITAEQPRRRQVCHVQSFAAEKLVCRSGIGRTRTYLPDRIAAVILPGDRVLTISLLAGFNAGLGASIWGTVILAAACPLCAAGTAAAALLFFDLAGATVFTGEDPERLVYLAPGQSEKDIDRFVHA